MVTIKEGTPGDAWKKFIKKSIESRLEVEKFEKFARQLSTKVSVSSFEIASIVISPETYPTSELSVDPRYLRYIQSLISTNTTSLADVLDAVLRSQQGQQNDASAEDGSGGSSHSREPVEAAILVSLATLIPTLKSGSSTVEEANRLMNVLGRWMDAVIAAGDGDGLGGMLNETMLEGLELGGGTMMRQKKDAIGELVAAIAENHEIGGWMKTGMGKDKRLLFDTNLPMFSNVFRATNAQLSSRLDALKRPTPSDEMGHRTVDGMMQELNVGLDAMGDVRVQGSGGMAMAGGQLSRAGLYIFFNALFVGRPLVDDEYILNYLHNRYKDDLQTMMMDFVVAILDCLSNAISRSESKSMMSIIRHFFVNKVPPMLARFHLPTITTQFILAQALLKSDSGILSLDPSMGSSAVGMMEFPADVKQEFLFACALHGVIEEGSIQEILGDVPLQTMAPKKYTQADLLNECLQDPERIERLLTEMEEMDGNSGAVVGAIVEVIRHMSYQKETMSLRNICNALTRSPKLLDLLMLYVKPSYVLEPLCELLDTWRYEEDQGEYQPVYEEFGYILLLVLAICFRYDLNLQDLGNIPHERFIPQLLTKGAKDPFVEDRDSRTNEMLGGWISALYGGDGVGDELLQSCRPQDFFMLVPAIFAQSVEACDRNIIDMDTLKGELEYLQLPFLIASQVGAITWLTNYLWQTHADVQSPLKILHALIFPAGSLTPDIAETHRTIIAMCARNLDRVLRDLVRGSAGAGDNHLAEQIIQEISQHLSYKRIGNASTSEIDSWKGANAGGGFVAALKTAVGSLVMWAATPDINMTPASYTHRLLLTAWRVLGARVVVKALVDELVAAYQTTDASAAIPPGDLTLDVVSAMICAPTVEDFNVRVHEVATGQKLPPSNASETGGRMTLADALRNLEEDAKMTMEDPGRGEIIMRLARRVEMQMGVGGSAGKFSGVGGVVVEGDGGDAGGVLVGDVDDGMGGVLGVDISDLTGAGLDVGGLGDDLMGGM